MKTRRFITLLILGLILSVTAINAQALVLKDFTWFLKTDDGIYPAAETMGVFTPSGNILHKQIFIIDEDDSLVPEKGINKVSFITWVTVDGVVWEMIDVDGMVFPNGKVMIVFHSNGAGTTPPPKK